MNFQREAFKGKVAEHMKGGAGDHEMTKEGGAGKPEHSSPVIGESKAMHHEDGTHSVEHHDGESSHHPNAAHMGMHMAAKHDGGEHGHIAPHGAGATTHHADIGGEIHGPDEHGSEDEAYAHLKGNIGDGAGTDETTPNMMGGEGGEDSSFE